MEAPSVSETYVLATIGNTVYALPSRDVVRMEMVEHVTPVPNAPDFVDGVVFSGGRVVPAINLRRRFGFEATAYNLRTRILVISHLDRVVGLIVDSAREFVAIPAEAIQPPPDVGGLISNQYLRGIATINGGIILILDMAGLLSGSPS